MNVTCGSSPSRIKVVIVVLDENATGALNAIIVATIAGEMAEGKLPALRVENAVQIRPAKKASVLPKSLGWIAEWK